MNASISFLKVGEISKILNYPFLEQRKISSKSVKNFQLIKLLRYIEYSNPKLGFRNFEIFSVKKFRQIKVCLLYTKLVK